MKELFIATAYLVVVFWVFAFIGRWIRTGRNDGQ